MGCLLKRGDINNDGQEVIANAVYLINYLYNNGPVPECITVKTCSREPAWPSFNF
jgi:hypothetical protein